VSRNGVDHARRFGDIAAAIAKLSARSTGARRVILRGGPVMKVLIDPQA
jgi:hypothetical protein